MHTLFNPFRVFICLCLWALAASVTAQTLYPDGFRESLVPLPAGRLGVVRDGKLHCLEVRNGAWHRCKDWELIDLPSDTRRVLGNERFIMLVRANRVDFLNENADPDDGKHLAWNSQWSPYATVNAENSTERGVTLVHKGNLVARMLDDPNSNLDLRLECPEAKGRRILGFGSNYGHWALVGQADVAVVSLRLDGRDRVLQCTRLKEMNWTAPQGTDEVTVTGWDVIAARKGSTVQFWNFGYGGAKEWQIVAPDPGSPAMKPKFPELSLDRVLAEPHLAPKSIKPVQRLDYHAMQALENRLTSGSYSRAEGLNGRFVRVAKITGSGSTERLLYGIVDTNAKVVVAPVYSWVEFMDRYDRFKVTKGEGNTARSGYLDERGQVVVPLVYQQLRRISNIGGEPTMVVMQNGKYGYLNFVTGKVHVAAVYDQLIAESIRIDSNGEGILMAKKNNKWALLDTNGKPLTAFEYDTFSDSGIDIVGIRPNGKQLITTGEMKILSIADVAPIVGIGAQLSMLPGDASALILKVLPFSPAAKANLQAEDRITKVNGEAVTGKSLDEVISLVRGPNGSTVTLEVQREKQVWQVGIKRAPLDTP